MRKGAEMTNARIYQKLKNAMQSGRAGTDSWILEYEPTDAQRADSLMGWAGSGDTRRQLQLKFATRQAAENYAAHNGLNTHVVPAPQKQLKLQAYADNFR
jgi:ETC complex I subunit conserved region